MIRMIEGYHLTARDRQAIAHAIRHGWPQCSTGRKWYEIEAQPDQPGHYRVRYGVKGEARTSRALIEWRAPKA